MINRFLNSGMLLLVVLPIVLSACELVKTKEDNAGILIKFRDKFGNPIWNVSAHIYAKNGEELAALSPALETLTLYKPKDSDAYWSGDRYLDRIDEGLNVVIKRGNRTLDSVNLTLKDFSGGYNWPTFFEMPAHHFSGCIYCAGHYSYSYTKKFELERQDAPTLDLSSGPVDISIQSGMIGLIPSSNDAIIILVDMYGSQKGGFGTSIAIYTSLGEILRPLGRFDEGGTAFFSFQGRSYKVENIKTRYDEGKKDIDFLGNDSAATFRIGEAAEEDVTIADLFWDSPKKLVKGNNVPDEVRGAVSAFRKQTSGLLPAGEVLGREFKVERVKGDKAQRDISEQESIVGKSILQGSSSNISNDDNYWYIVATNGSSKVFGYVRCADLALAAVCLKQADDPRQR